MTLVAIPPYSAFELSQCNFINKLIAELKKNYGLSSFAYHKIFWNQKYIRLISHKEAAIYVNENIKDTTLEGMFIPLGQRYFFKTDVDKNCEYYQQILKPFAEKFDMEHLVIKCQYNIGSTEMFIFTASKAVENFERTFLSDQHVFSDFIFYFKQQTAKLLKENAHHFQKINVTPQIRTIAEKSATKLYNRIIAKNNSKNDTKRFYFEYKNNQFYLTKTEMKCIRLLLQGYSYQMIANKLSISTRTVQSNIDRLRRKMLFDNKDELIAFMHNSNLVEDIIKKTEILPEWEKQQTVIPENRRQLMIETFKGDYDKDSIMYKLMKYQVLNNFYKVDVDHQQ